MRGFGMLGLANAVDSMNSYAPFVIALVVVLIVTTCFGDLSQLIFKPPATQQTADTPTSSNVKQQRHRIHKQISDEFAAHNNTVFNQDEYRQQ